MRLRWLWAGVNTVAHARIKIDLTRLFIGQFTEAVQLGFWSAVWNLFQATIDLRKMPWA